MKRTLVLAATILAIANLAPAQEQKPAPAAAPQFKTLVPAIELNDGDSFVFLGDSITHQCLYTQYVEDYFYTRFPTKRIHFHNAGVGGDRAADALARFDDDVAAFKPKYVSILLGMNDGTYRDFDKAVFDTYTTGMTTVLDRIAAIGATAIPMTPTMHDARDQRLRGKVQEPRDTFYNGVLALYGRWLQEQAEVRGLGFVDMFGPLNDLTLQRRKTDANWTMIQDGVHPGPVGQTVMAVAIIEDIVKKSPVSAIIVQAGSDKPAPRAVNGKLTDFTRTDTGVAFTFLANALPWVLPPDTAEGAELTKLGHRYSNEKLTVRGLAAGKYTLKIDGTEVGQWTDAQLGVGIELQSVDKTPQYQQALKVAMLNKERNEKTYQHIRNNFAQLKMKRRDLKKAEDAKAADLDAKRSDFETWHTKMKSDVAKLLEDARRMEDEIYKANQPAPRKYEVIKL